MKDMNITIRLLPVDRPLYDKHGNAYEGRCVWVQIKFPSNPSRVLENYAAVSLAEIEAAVVSDYAEKAFFDCVMRTIQTAIDADV